MNAEASGRRIWPDYTFVGNTILKSNFEKKQINVEENKSENPNMDYSKFEICIDLSQSNPKLIQADILK